MFNVVCVSSDDYILALVALFLRRVCEDTQGARHIVCAGLRAHTHLYLVKQTVCVGTACVGWLF